jgi:hypothetical protein
MLLDVWRGRHDHLQWPIGEMLGLGTLGAREWQDVQLGPIPRRPNATDPRVEDTGGRPDHLVDLEVDSLNKAVTPAGVHKYRGNFKGQYLGSGGWSPVAGDPKASPTQSFAVGTRYRARRRPQAACFVTDKGSCFTWSGAGRRARPTRLVRLLSLQLSATHQ